jgi:hypothetical protein
MSTLLPSQAACPHELTFFPESLKTYTQGCQQPENHHEGKGR